MAMVKGVAIILKQHGNQAAEGGAALPQFMSTRQSAWRGSVGISTPQFDFIS